MKCLKAAIVLPALCCSCVAPTPVAGPIVGYVVDGNTRKPISEAEVFIEQHPKARSVTDADGSFMIPRFYEWKFYPMIFPVDHYFSYDVSVEADGYVKRSLPSSDYHAGEIQLEPTK